MNIKLRNRQRTNGDLSQPKWEKDDAEDMLIAKLAEAEVKSEPAPAPPAPEVKKPSPPPTPAKVEEQKPPATPAVTKPKVDINVKELMNTLLEAWTNDTVRMWCTGNELHFEQIDPDTMTKNCWNVGFSHVRTHQIKLIK